MNWNLGYAFLTSILTAIMTAAVGFVFSNRLYKDQQKMAWEEKRRQQAAEVGNLLSLFLLASYRIEADPNLHRYELQKKYWELALWLDAPVLRAVHNALAHPSDPIPDINKALVTVRQLLVAKDDMISPNEFFHWTPHPRTENDHLSLSEQTKQEKITH